MKKNNIFLIFCLANIITFTFLVCLQLFKPPIFFVMLVCMHIGVALFIISKKMFKKQNVNVKKYYLIEYALLALYLPILGYKLLSYTGLYEVNEKAKLIVVIVITSISTIISLINIIKLKKIINNI